MEIRALMKAMWRSRTGPLLVAAQVAITLAVLTNVAYIVQQRLETAGKPTGMDVDNIFWATVQPYVQEYNYEAAARSDLAWLNSLPAVVAATTTNILPQTWSGLGLPFAAKAEQLNTPNGGTGGRIYYADERFIDAFGLKLAAGRNFAASMVVPPEADMGASLATWPPEMIVTREMADKLFPGGDALGKTVYVGLVNRSSTIIGIVDHMQGVPIGGRFEQFGIQIVLVPLTPPGPNSLYVVRTKPGERDATMARVEKELADRQPGRFLGRVEAFSRTASLTRAGYRSSAIILSVVGLFVLAVTVVGIVGLAAFNVATRTKQLGTRRAIGARKFHILRYFLVENWIITTIGCLVGCTLALAAGVKLSVMYMMPRLPLYYLVAGVLCLWAVGFFAVLLPARRAASISPATATRTV